MHVIHVKRALDLILILLLMSLQGGQSSQGSLTENGQIVHKAWQRLIYHEIYHIYHKYVRCPKTSAFPFQLTPETLFFLRILTNFVTGCHVTHQFSRRLGKVSTKRLTCATTQNPLMLKSNCAPKEHNTHTHTREQLHVAGTWRREAPKARASTSLLWHAPHALLTAKKQKPPQWSACQLQDGSGGHGGVRENTGQTGGGRTEGGGEGWSGLRCPGVRRGRLLLSGQGGPPPPAEVLGWTEAADPPSGTCGKTRNTHDWRQ